MRDSVVYPIKYKKRDVVWLQVKSYVPYYINYENKEM